MFVKNIKWILKRRGIFYSDLARDIEKSDKDSHRRRYSRICSGDTKPTLEDIIKISSELCLDPGKLAFLDHAKFVEDILITEILQGEKYELHKRPNDCSRNQYR